MTNTPHETAAEIINHYGAKHQLIQLMEECAELIQAASKCVRKDIPYSDDFIEEMGDVFIMLWQFESIMPEYQKQLLQDMIARKLHRQVERMEVESNAD